MDFGIFREQLQGSISIELRSSLYRSKVLNEGYNFGSDLISIRGLHTKLCGLKVVGVPMLAILGLSGQNAIWMWVSWRGIEYTIRGKVVASSKFRSW